MTPSKGSEAWRTAPTEARVALAYTRGHLLFGVPHQGGKSAVTTTTIRLVPIGMAAMRFGISRERLRQRIDRGEIPAIRDAAGHRFVEEITIQRLLAEGKMPGPIAAAYPKTR